MVMFAFLDSSLTLLMKFRDLKVGQEAGFSFKVGFSYALVDGGQVLC